MNEAYAMDFSALNPISTNSLNLAARNNDVAEVRRLLKAINPNCTDNRGWACIHEAAANNSFESLKLILKNNNTRPLALTHEGHSALYLAIRGQSSVQLIAYLLKKVKKIATYCSTENVSPMHLACQNGMLDVVELLLKYDKSVDIADCDGDTPLHDAAYTEHIDVIAFLLKHGASPDKCNERGYTPLHLACMKGNLKCIEEMSKYVKDIDILNYEQETALFVAAEYGHPDVVQFLLFNGANPNLVNKENRLPLIVSIFAGEAEVFKILFKVTDRQLLNKNILSLVCKPHNFTLEIMRTILASDLGPEFFNHSEKFLCTVETVGGKCLSYEYCPPLAPMLHISEYVYKTCKETFRTFMYAFLKRGVPVNAQNEEEIPPLVYLHYCDHEYCCSELVDILVSNGSNVDYYTMLALPLPLLASISTTGLTLKKLFAYSTYPDCWQMLELIDAEYLYGRLWKKGREQLSEICGKDPNSTLTELIATFPTLQHCCRVKIRQMLRLKCKNTQQFLSVIHHLKLPKPMLNYIRYIPS